MSKMPAGLPHSSSDQLDDEYARMLQQHQADLAARRGQPAEARPKPRPYADVSAPATRPQPPAKGRNPFSAYERPTNLPPGFSVYEDEHGRSNLYMQGPDGKLHFTPDYAKNHGMHIDWHGVANDLGRIAIGSALGAAVWPFLGPQSLPVLVGGTALSGLETDRELIDIDKEQRKGRRP